METLFNALNATFGFHNWNHVNTGGGCTAIMVDNNEFGEHWLITKLNDGCQSPNDVNDAVMCCLYDDEGCLIDRSCIEASSIYKLDFDIETLTFSVSG